MPLCFQGSVSSCLLKPKNCEGKHGNANKSTKSGYLQTVAMVKYCMNLETGSVRDEDNLSAISPRINTNLERLLDLDPRTGTGFRAVPVPADLPLELQAGRGRPRGRGGNEGI